MARGGWWGAQTHLVAIERIHQKRQKITVQVQVCHSNENTRSLTHTLTHTLILTLTVRETEIFVQVLVVRCLGLCQIH